MISSRGVLIRKRVLKEKLSDPDWDIWSWVLCHRLKSCGQAALWDCSRGWSRSSPGSCRCSGSSRVTELPCWPLACIPSSPWEAGPSEQVWPPQQSLVCWSERPAGGKCWCSCPAVSSSSLCWLWCCRQKGRNSWRNIELEIISLSPLPPPIC